jgi:TRAP-type C4-dicarboxylate transport system permease small subunit
LARPALFLACVILIYVAAHTIADIVFRAMLGRSTGVSVEFVGYALAAMTFLALADAMRSGVLVRVNLLLTFAPRRLRQALDVLCLCATLAVVLFAAWYFWIDLRRSYLRDIETDSIIPLPMWMPPLGLFLGLLVFALDLVIHIVRALRGGFLIPDGGSERI